MSESTVLYDARGGVARITLNRPEARNALTAGSMGELISAFESASSDSDVRIVILTGAGEAFCAGLDLRELASGSGIGSEGRGIDELTTPWKAIEAFEGPILGAINGPAVTAGFEIALACDLLIASTEARFADTHVRVGVLPGAGLSQRLPRAIGIYRAKYLSLTGNFLSAAQAAEWGLVSHVVEPDDLLETAESIAADMLSAMPHMLAPIKAVIDEGFAGTLADGLELESRTSARHMAEMQPQSGAGAALDGLRERSRAD